MKSADWQRFPGMKEQQAQKSNGDSVIELLLCAYGDFRREQCFLFTPRFGPLTRKRDCTSASVNLKRAPDQVMLWLANPFAYPSFRHEPSKLLKLP